MPKEFDPARMFTVHFKNNKSFISWAGPLARYNVREGDELVTINGWRPTHRRLNRLMKRKNPTLKLQIKRSDRHRIVYAAP